MQAYTKLITFDAQTLVNLLVAYTDGEVPLDTKILNVGIGAMLQRWVGINTESEQWPSDLPLMPNGATEPLHIRYEGRRNMRWSKADENSEIMWGREGEDFETAKRK